MAKNGQFDWRSIINYEAIYTIQLTFAVAKWIERMPSHPNHLRGKASAGQALPDDGFCKIQEIPEGFLYWVPYASRKKKWIATLLWAYGAMFVGGITGVLAWHEHMPAQYVCAFALLGLPLLWMFPRIWIGTTRITARSGLLQIRNHSLLWSFTRTIPLESIREISVRIFTQRVHYKSVSGDNRTIYFVDIHRKQGRPLRVECDFPTFASADWLAHEMETRSGLARA